MSKTIKLDTSSAKLQKLIKRISHHSDLISSFETSDRELIVSDVVYRITRAAKSDSLDFTDVSDVYLRKTISSARNDFMSVQLRASTPRTVQSDDIGTLVRATLSGLCKPNRDLTFKNPDSFIPVIDHDLLHGVTTKDVDEVNLRDVMDRFWTYMNTKLNKSPDLFKTLYLRYHDDLDYKEIAAELEVPIGTVQSRLGYLHKLLRKDDYVIGCFQY